MLSAAKEDSLGKRYFYKLATNMTSVFIGIFTQAIIPRGLGPKLYGDYNFLTNFFNQMISFFDMGTSTCFFTKLSQRPKEIKLIAFYFRFIGIIAIIVLSIIGLAQAIGLNGLLWPNQLLIYIYMAAFICIAMWTTGIISQIADAYGLTASAELAKIFQKLLGLVILITLFLWKRLSLEAFFIYNYCIFFLLACMLFYVIRSHGYHILNNLNMSFYEIKRHAREFYSYSHPFFMYGLFGMIAGIFDRWLLQIYAGSVEQGFFGLSYQIGAICFMFTSAMTPLIMREFSIAYNNKDVALMAQLFRKHVPLLYSITALLACFAVINADKVTILMGGGRFQNAAPAVAIMAFYPIHQAYGQLSGSVFFASNRIRLYCNIGIIFMAISLPITYFLIAPKTLFGLNAGAAGLAFKIVLMQFLTVNVMLYFNARLLDLRFWRYLYHQLISIAVFLILAFFSRILVEYVFGIRMNNILNFILTGIVYLTASLVFVYFIPAIIGLRKK